MVPTQVQAQNKAEAQPQVSSVQGCCPRAPWRRAQGARDEAASKAAMQGEGTGPPHCRKTKAFLQKEGRAGHLGEVEHDISLLVLETPRKAENRGEGERLPGRAPVVTGTSVCQDRSTGSILSPTGAVPCHLSREELSCQLLCPGGAVLASPVAVG